jgi:hypothetical protein
VHSQGTKVITLRSNYKIVNETPFDVEVFVESSVPEMKPLILTLGKYFIFLFSSLSLSLSLSLSHYNAYVTHVCNFSTIL